LRPIEDEEEEIQEESPPSPYVPIDGEAMVKYNFKADSAREISVGKVSSDYLLKILVRY
jgi:hypothetical protein